MMPHALDIEQCLLGCLLACPACLPASAELTADDFYDRRHQMIFRTIREQHEKNRPVDIVIIAQLLKEKSQLTSAGGRAYLTDLVMAVTSSLFAPYYVKVINEKSLLRRLIRAGQEIAAVGYSGCDAQESVRKAKTVLHRAISESQSFQPFSELQCAQLINRYDNELELWDKFWRYMDEQVNSGACLQYVRACHDKIDAALQKKQGDKNVA